jgi:hypothetical protein
MKAVKADYFNAYPSLKLTEILPVRVAEFHCRSKEHPPSIS